jgi:hypothetical protein
MFMKKKRYDMPKDSQIDKKEVREKKSKGQISIATEAQNHNKNIKKQSAKRDDV